MIRVYLRASTQDQNAERAKELLSRFVSSDMNDADCVYYIENVSGTKLERPELNRLLNESEANDILLVESVDRLSRLTQTDWETLKAKVNAKGLRLVVRDLDTTHKQFESGITGDIMRVINSMLIDLMATMARLDNEKRIERTKQGIALAKAAKALTSPILTATVSTLVIAVFTKSAKTSSLIIVFPPIMIINSYT